MQKDEKLDEVAKDIGHEIKAGETEVSLDQPFPEELNETPSKIEPQESSSEQPESNRDKSDKPKTRKKVRIAQDANNMVLLFVGIGILVCLVGLLIVVFGALILGFIAILLGALIIAVGVYAPLGY